MKLPWQCCLRGHWAGYIYGAFVHVVFACSIVGWPMSGK